MPRLRFASASMSRWKRSSSSSCRSSELCRNWLRSLKRNVRMGIMSGSGFKKALDRPGNPVPARSLLGKLFAAGPGHRIIPGSPVILGDAPPGLDPASLFKPQQGRIKRALIELQYVLRDLLDSLSNAITVHRPHDVQGPQNQEIQSTLKYFVLFIHLTAYRNIPQ